MAKIAFLWIVCSFAPSALAQTPSAAGQPHWYMMSDGGKAAGYYVETVGRAADPGLLLSSRKVVTLGSKVANYEIDTVFADDDSLTPVSFELHFRRRDGSRELKLSGHRLLKDKLHQIELKFEQIRPAEPSQTKLFSYAKGSIFMTSLPRFLARHKPGLYAVPAIDEDVRKLELQVRQLRITRTSESKVIDGRSCEHSYVDLGSPEKFDLWVDKDGLLCESSIGGPEVTIKPTTEEAMKKLDPPGK